MEDNIVTIVIIRKQEEKLRGDQDCFIVTYMIDIFMVTQVYLTHSQTAVVPGTC